MGPIELADTVGLDVCAHVGKILKSASPDGTKLDQMVAAGKLGKKSGEGFYVWKDGKPEKAEPEKPYDKFELERLGPRAGRAADRARRERVRDERIVESADLVDAGVIFGTGFAPFRGGPLHFKASEEKSNVEVLSARRRSDQVSDPPVRHHDADDWREGQTRRSDTHRSSHDQTLRRVAVIGGVRIPFCRSNTFYADLSNLEMLTARAQRAGRQVQPQGRAHRRGGRRRRGHPLARTGTWRARPCSAPSSRPRRPASP